MVTTPSELLAASIIPSSEMAIDVSDEEAEALLLGGRQTTPSGREFTSRSICGSSTTLLLAVMRLLTTTYHPDFLSVS
jgi:hypothetical protein